MSFINYSMSLAVPIDYYWRSFILAISSRYHKSKKEMLTEVDLIEKSKSNVKYFGPIYDKYYEDIFNFIYKRVGQESTTGDITSDVFYKAVKNIHKYTYKGLPFSSWLYRIAVNEINQYFRKTNAVRFLSVEQDKLNEVAQTVGEAYHLQDPTDVIIKLLESLNEEEVLYIELRFFEGLSFKEVGEVLNASADAVKVKTYRIIGKLRRSLHLKYSK